MVRERVLCWGVLLALAASCQHREPPAAREQPATLAPPPSAPIGIAACDDYLRRVRACAKLPDAARTALLAGTAAWSTAARTASENACRDTAKAAAPQLAELGC